MRALVFTARAEYSPSLLTPSIAHSPRVSRLTQIKSSVTLLLTRATPTRELIEQKPHAGDLVVGWVTTSESSLLYVFVSIFLFRPIVLVTFPLLPASIRAQKADRGPPHFPRCIFTIPFLSGILAQKMNSKFLGRVTCNRGLGNMPIFTLMPVH